METAKRPSKEQLRLVQSFADFSMCLSALEFVCELDEAKLVSRVERRRYRCYEDSATLSYCRAFGGNGLPTLTFEEVGLILSDEEKLIHKKIRAHRDKVIAHSDADRMRVLLTVDSPFENNHIMVPLVVFDDGLVLFDDRWRWSELVRRIHAAVYKTLFDQVQGHAPFRVLKDWLHREE